MRSRVPVAVARQGEDPRHAVLVERQHARQPHVLRGRLLPVNTEHLAYLITNPAKSPSSVQALDPLSISRPRAKRQKGGSETHKPFKRAWLGAPLWRPGVRRPLEEKWEVLLEIRLLGTTFGVDCQTIRLPLHRCTQWTNIL